MRGSPWHRAISAIMAVWLILFLGEPTWLHSCALHSLHGSISATAGAAGNHATHGHAAAGHGDGIAAHAAHATDAHTPPAPHAHGGTNVHASQHAPPPAPQAHHCTCPGDCCSAPGIALHADAIDSFIDALITTVDTGRPQYEYVAAWVAFVLPFATAPPTFTLA